LVKILGPESIWDERNMTATVPRKQAVILVGFMGAGKSSVGRALAARLNWSFEDLDTRIERRENKSVPDIFRAGGEEYFRGLEQGELQELLSELPDEAKKVIALGGGTFAQSSCAKVIEDAAIPTIFLDATLDELWRRCTEKSEEPGLDRPMLRDLRAFRALYEKRRPCYLAASHTLETTGKTVDEVVAELIKVLDVRGWMKTERFRGE
jgi:shikimate kinase